MPTATSADSPLRIAAIFPPSGGVIGMTLCPGKKQQGAISGPWNRDIERDFDAVVEWGANSVVSLIENSELTDLGVPDLGAVTKNRELNWYHLPITDQNPPDSRFEQLWDTAGPEIRQTLSSGGRVLIHCKGGLGRTGTVAAQLLIEFGLTVDEAIHEVREARPHAIERKEQEAYLYHIGQYGYLR